MHNPSFNMVYPAFRCGHGKLCNMNFLTSTTVLLKEEEFIDQNRTVAPTNWREDPGRFTRKVGVVLHRV